jgi:hypothetical protein
MDPARDGEQGSAAPISRDGSQVMAPAWVTVVAWSYLSVCFCCAAIISYDIAINRRRQPMGVMNFVFPITALYFGPAALAFYWRWARVPARTRPAAMPAAESTQAVAVSRGGMMPGGHAHHDTPPEPGPAAAERGEPTRPHWVTMAIEVSHCGAGCSLGDVISEFAVFALGLTVAGLTIGAEYIGDYLVALAFGILFQYFAIAPMRGLGVKDGLVAASKADFISLTAFEVGLFGWMAFFTVVLFPAPHSLMPDAVAYWLLMQVGMMIGFATSWPANAWLVRRGIKVPM